MDHPDCRDAKRVHLLNEDHVPAWGLFQTIRPVFASTSCRWKVKEEKTLRQDKVLRLEGGNALACFKDELRKLPMAATENDLACNVWESCIGTLSEVLELLESIVKDDCISWEEKQSYEKSKDNNQTTHHLDLVWRLLDSLRTHKSSPANIEHSQEPAQPDSEDHVEFSKLAALAKIISGDSHIGELYVEAEQPIEVFQKFRILETFRSCVEEAYKDRKSTIANTRPFSTPKFPRTKWKDHGPSKALDQLHHILVTHAIRCKDERHEILLKMSGPRFEDLAFDAIVVPCRNHDRHQEVRFLSDHARAIDHFESRQFVHDFCDTLEDIESADPDTIPNFIFSDDGKHRLHYSRAEDEPHSNISIDTTLQTLQEEQYFQKPDDGGVFDTVDKTVLELVLAQSLLHLLQSPWRDLQWCADSIRFLRRRNINELLDIHHPYLTYFVKPVRPSADPMAWYAETMTSFAQLLLEIESGKAVELEDAILADTGRKRTFLYAEMNRRGNRFEIRSHVQPAIENCLRLYAVLARYREDPDNDTNFGFLVRKTIYETIIYNLENCLAAIENNKTFLHGRNLRMRHDSIGKALLGDTTPETWNSMESVPASGNSHIIQQHQRNTMQYDEPLQVDKIMMFDSSNVPDHVAVAKQFWKDHQSFYNKYILSKARSRPRNSRRVRIAILDTGIDKNDAFLKSQTDKIKKDRWERVRQEFAAEPTRDWPHSSTCDPIKATKSFLASSAEDSIIDQCGHGTTTLGLLLRVAPDADIYVAKVADGLKFEDTSAVVKAIKWAADHDVDILSMSFGMRGQDDGISHAISSIDLDKTIMFSSASNGGTGVPRTYPASDYRVIAVHALSGNGDEGSMNPVTERNQDAFGTLGYGVEATWKNENRILNGTSYSTPIAAGIIANLFEWVDSVAAEESASGVTEKERKYWKSPNGIRHILQERMSRRKHKLKFILPWILFDLDKEMTDSSIITMLRYGLKHAPL